MARTPKFDPITVYHGSYTDYPPHEFGGDKTFHAGTEKSAYARLNSTEHAAAEHAEIEHEYGDGPAGPPPATMHTYQLTKRPSTIIYEDPDEPDSVPENDPYIMDLQVNQGHHIIPSQVLQYRNRFEDKGAISYVIPKHLVGKGHVKYLGAQFLG